MCPDDDAKRLFTELQSLFMQRISLTEISE
jgi:hypothetical protein